ncbi:MAG: DUF1848 domain-containing protein [Candidatus Syntrophoarchaeum sp. WYZ-LMO15]|nr:MAG: DUF1848 domain-containing protein [Candidatus Syntrophoarchaeum sp. WYZ-LMO15]
MARIISASRRTDIPAFYGDWFMKRLEEGFAGYINPFGGQKYIVSLRPDDVTCFVFWSKNFRPFIEKLEDMERMGYRFYFNFTITGLPRVFEPRVISKDAAIDTLKELSTIWSPEHINWRYDPIIISEITDYDFHIENFKDIASRLEGYVRRCYFSYAVWYGKVRRRFEKLEEDCGISVFDPDKRLKIKLADELARIADCYGIDLFTCCGDYLVSSRIRKAHCIDGEIIKELFYREGGFVYRIKPTRDGCGCAESTDIGAYDTCPHGCIYCYANANKSLALTRFKYHDSEAAFLGTMRGS